MTRVPHVSPSERLESLFGDVGPIRECYVVGVPCKGYGYVKYALPTDADAAVKTLNKQDVEGRKLRVSIARPRKGVQASGSPSGDPQKKAARRRFRLIVRNLSWDTDGGELKKLFLTHSRVVDVHVPRKADGAHRGFAFVEVASEADANNAINTLNAREVGGRQIAVDHAVSKERYRRLEQSTEPGAAVDAPPVKRSADDLQRGDAKRPKQDRAVSPRPPADKGLGDGPNGRDVPGEKSTAAVGKKPRKERPPRKAGDDLERTVFVQNLPYDVEEAEVGAAFGTVFGTVERCALVKDKVTGLPRGNGFVVFKSKESVAPAIEPPFEGDETSGVWLRGRQARVLPAVDKGRAQELVQAHADERVAAKKDKASYGKRQELATLGVIFAGSPEALAISAAELKQHELRWAQKKKKLQSPHYVVSPTRLSVRHLPLGSAAPSHPARTPEPPPTPWAGAQHSFRYGGGGARPDFRGGGAARRC